MNKSIRYSHRLTLEQGFSSIDPGIEPVKQLRIIHKHTPRWKLRVYEQKGTACVVPGCPKVGTHFRVLCDRATPGRWFLNLYTDDNTKMTVDHIVPLSAGGSRSNMDNLQPMCAPHNNNKGGVHELKGPAKELCQEEFNTIVQDVYDRIPISSFPEINEEGYVSIPSIKWFYGNSVKYETILAGKLHCAREGCEEKATKVKGYVGRDNLYVNFDLVSDTGKVMKLLTLFPGNLRGDKFFLFCHKHKDSREPVYTLKK